jgi:drug/metabolite transporter (DMT)-like permease
MSDIPPTDLVTRVVAPRSAPRRALPLLAAALAYASFTCMDATVKLIAPRYDALQLTFLRFASGALFALALWMWFRSPMPPRAAWRLHGLRCVLLLASLTGYFHALTLLPLLQAVAISYTAPLFLSLLAMLLLGERPTPWIWGALALGLAGVGVSLAPALWAGTDAASAGQVEGLLSAAAASLAFAGVMVLARKQAQQDSLWTILLLQNLLPLTVLAVPTAWRWREVPAADLAPIVLIGALATVGLLALTWAFKHLEAIRVAPLEYTSFVWAGLLGYTLFGEIPTATTALSAALVISGCLLLLRR